MCVCVFHTHRIELINDFKTAIRLAEEDTEGAKLNCPGMHTQATHTYHTELGLTGQLSAHSACMAVCHCARVSTHCHTGV